MLLLQQQPDRWARYRAMGAAAALPELGCIGVFEPALIAEIFRSERFAAVDFADHVRRVGERTGLDFTASLRTLDHIPLAKEGEDHRRLREAMAAVLAGKLPETERRLAALLPERLARWTEGAEIDLRADLAEPVYDVVLSVQLGVDAAALERGDHNSRVFDLHVSLNRRKEIEASLASSHRSFSAALPKGGPVPDVALAASVLGNDALVGSLTLSLWHEFGRHPDTPLDAMRLHPTLPATAVPYIERIALADTEVEGLAVGKGGRVRLYIDAATAEALGTDGGVAFGKGRHLCLGKPVAELAWRMTAKALSALPFVVEPVEMRWRKGDYAFNFPERARIRLRR